MKEYHFKAKLLPAIGGGAFVEFPYDVQKEFGKARVPIQCTINGEPYRGTMIKYGRPRHLVPVLKAIREKTKRDLGDEVEIWLVEYKQKRTVELPLDLKRILKKNDLRAVFGKLSYTHKKEYVQWIKSAKKEETRVRRLEKTLAMIRKNR